MARVQITFSGSPGLLDSEQWLDFKAAFIQQMPLRNLFWKSSTRTSIRTIQELDVNLIPFEPMERVPQTPAQLLERPMLNLYVIVCEDIDAYKNFIRKSIQDWHLEVSRRSRQEWLLLLLRPEINVSGKRLFQMKGNVLDKIKGDFNTDKKDRCTQLTWTPNVNDPTAWAEFISKIKDGIVSSFDSNVILREDEVRKSESLRQSTDWSFCKFSILKETLASNFEGMNLLDDAQIQLDELEASFFQVSKEKGRSPLPRFGGDSPKDDSAPLLSTTKKPYRDLMLSNTISVFDFRVYLLGRQCELLIRRSDFLGAIKKASWFIHAFAQALVTQENSFGTFYIESWTYSAALNTIDRSREWEKILNTDAIAHARLDSVRGELFELARIQLDKIGLAVGHLPPLFPFLVASPSRASNAGVNPISVTQKDLIAAITDRDTFDKLYAMITNRAIEAYTASCRKRFALRMHGSIAALDQLRNRVGPALSIYSSLPAHYVGSKWSVLEGAMLAESLRIHSQPGQSRNNEWLRLALEFLKVSASLKSDSSGQRVLTRSNFIDSLSEPTQALLQEIRAYSTALDHDFIVNGHSAFSFSLDEPRIPLPDHSGIHTLIVKIFNLLPCNVVVDRIALRLTRSTSASTSSRLAYSHPGLELLPGINRATLSCTAPSSGTFYVEEIRMEMSKLVLCWSLDIPVNSKTRKAHRLLVVSVPEHTDAMDLSVSPPRTFELGAKPKLHFTLSIGKQDITQLVMGVTDATGHLALHFDAAEGRSEIVPGPESVTFRSLSANSTVEIHIPYDANFVEGPVSISVQCQYWLLQDPNTSRLFRKNVVVSGDLPVIVNVQDFFRRRRLVSRFTVSSDGSKHVRIVSAELRGAPSTSAIQKSQRFPSLQYVSPLRPLNYVFSVDLNPENRSESVDNLQFVLRYLTFEEEVDARLRQVAAEISPRLSSDQISRISRTFLSVLRSDRQWAQIYAVTRRISLPGVWSNGIAHTSMCQAWRNLLSISSVQEKDVPGSLISEEELDSLAKVLEQITGRLNTEPSSLIDGPSRELILPLDLPHINIINSVKLDLPLEHPIYAGQALCCTLRIRTSFSSQSVGLPTCRLKYEIANNELNSWLISGRIRNDFEAKDETVYEDQLMLIALRHGVMHLPTISVSLVPHFSKLGVLPHTSETHQEHAAVRINVLPRSARATYSITLPSPQQDEDESEVG